MSYKGNLLARGWGGGGGGGLVQNRESPDFRSPEVGRYVGVQLELWSLSV